MFKDWPVLEALHAFLKLGHCFYNLTYAIREHGSQLKAPQSLLRGVEIRVKHLRQETGDLFPDCFMF